MAVAAVALALTAALVAALPEADAARRADSHWRRAEALGAPLSRSRWQGADEQYAAAIAEAAAAAALRPDDAAYLYGLSFLRWQAVARDADPQTGLPPTDPDTAAYAADIVGDLHGARRLCPTFGRAYTLAGQIEWSVLGRRAEGAAHVRAGYRLSPQDAAAAFVAGRLEATDGNTEASVRALRRAVALDGSLRREATDVYVREINRPDLAVALADDDPDWLLDLAAELTAAGTAAGPDSPAATAARDAGARGADRLKARCDRPDAPAGDLVRLASLYDEQGNPAGAVDVWRRALARDLHQADWRLRLARSLAAAGRRDEARREVQTCLWLRPGMPEAEKLDEDLARETPATVHSP